MFYAVKNLAQSLLCSQIDKLVCCCFTPRPSFLTATELYLFVGTYAANHATDLLMSSVLKWHREVGFIFSYLQMTLSAKDAAARLQQGQNDSDEKAVSGLNVEHCFAFSRLSVSLPLHPLVDVLLRCKSSSSVANVRFCGWTRRFASSLKSYNALDEPRRLARFASIACAAQAAVPTVLVNAAV
jgi:hypothetical protein